MKKTLTLLLLLAGLTLDAQAETLTWNGSESHMTWNTTDDNWLLGETSAKYKNGVSVVFGNTGSGVVTLDGDLKPASALVEADNEYIFTGTGKLTGSMQLTKSGSGKLAINTANDYTGGTNVNGGTLVLGDNKALGKGTVTLGDNATLDLNNHTLSNSVSLAGVDTNIGNGAIEVTLSVGQNQKLTLIGNLYGTGSVKMGQSSTLDLGKNTLSTSISLLGSASIGNGTLNGSFSVGAEQILTLIGNLSGTGSITMGDQSMLQLDGKTLSKDVTLNGNVSITNGTLKGNVAVAAGKCLSMSGDIDMTGAIALGEGATLNMGDKVMDMTGGSVSLSGLNAEIGNGTLNGSISVGEWQILTLSGNLSGTDSITLGENAELALGNNTLSKDVTLTGDATIGTGTIKGSVSVEAGKCLYLAGNLDGEGSINLGDQSTLDLRYISILIKDVTLTGDSATIGNGTINGNITVGAEKTLTLVGKLSGTVCISLGDQSNLNLGNDRFANNVTVEGSNATISNGTIDGNLILADNVTFTWGNPSLKLAGAVSLNDQSTLNLGKNTLSSSVIVEGSNVTISNGTLAGIVTVNAGKSLILQEIAAINGTISQGNGSTLNMGGAKVGLSMFTFTGQSATIDNGTLLVESGATVMLNASLSGSATISLGEQSSLDLGGKTLSTSVSLVGDSANIGNGVLDSKIIVDAGKKLTLSGNLSGNGDISLGDQSTLDLGEKALSTSVSLAGGSANIGNGAINVDLTIGAGKTLTLIGNLAGNGGISLGDNAELDLGKNTLSTSVSLTGDSANIGNGALGSKIVVDTSKTLTLSGNLSGVGSISLDDKATLDLGENALSTSVTVIGGQASIGNGVLDGSVTVEKNKSLFLKKDVVLNKAITLDDSSTLDMDGAEAVLSSKFKFAGQSATIDNATLLVESGETVTLNGSLSGSATISLGDNATLDFGENTLSTAVTVNGDSANVGNGVLGGSVSVEAGKTLTLIGDLSGEGNISLGEQSTLDLGNNTLSNSITLLGTAAITTGVLDGSVSVEAGKTLTLIGDLSGEGNISLGEQSSLDLGGKTLSTSVTVNGDLASISAGMIDGSVSVGKGKKLTLSGNLSGEGNISLGDNAELDLGNNTLFTSVTLLGSARIGNGVLDGSVSVEAGNTLTLLGNLSGNGNIFLGDNATLNLGKTSFSNNVIVQGSDASICNGTIGGDLILAENASFTWDDPSLQLVGDVILGYQSTLNLGNASISNNVIVDESNANIGNGTITGNVTVKADKSLFLNNSVVINAAITLGDNAELNLGNNTLFNSVAMLGSATIGNGVLDSEIVVDSGKKLTLNGNLSGNGDISLGDNAELDLGKNTLSTSVFLDGNSANIGNGVLDSKIIVDSGKKLTLSDNLSGEGNISLCDKAKLDLGNNTLSNSVTVLGSASIGNGALDGSVSVEAGNTLTLLGNLSGNGGISLGDNATLDLGGKTLSNIVNISASSASIGNGTLFGINRLNVNEKTLILSGNLKSIAPIMLSAGGTLNLNTHTLSAPVFMTGMADDKATISGGTLDGKVSIVGEGEVHFSGETHIKGGSIAAGATTVKALAGAEHSLLHELSVSEGLIAGTGRAASLADGLDISRMGYDLKLENLVLTANNKISVGDGHTITLHNVTIKISDDIAELKEGIFYFDLKSLINCDLVMENVLLDASDLTLPQGFDLAKDAVAFDFGDDVTIKQATGLDMRVGNYWSLSLNLDEQGKVIFTKLVETPEPTTGTLSLLALAALAARRRKR